MKYWRAAAISLGVAVIVAQARAVEVPKQQALDLYASVPLAFTLNEGQVSEQVAFVAGGGGATIFFTPEGTTFLLSRQKREVVSARQGKMPGMLAFEHGPWMDVETRRRELYALKVRFVGANPNPEIIGEDRLPWDNNYFIGNDPSRWRTGVPNYRKIRLRNLYDGIDLVYYGNNKRLKYDFVVESGADPSQIVLAYEGAEDLGLTPEAELEVQTPLGKLVERKPYAYQVVNGETLRVDVSYKPQPRTAAAGRSHALAFSLGSYDRTSRLYIDPELVYSTYLGGAGADHAFAIAVDGAGNVYVTGHTNSADFPTTAGALDRDSNGGYDAFVSELNADGSAIVFSTYLGGGERDEAYGIAVDGAGDVYLTGATQSGDFPTTAGALDRDYHGGEHSGDAFVSKLSASGSSLVFSTYLGGGADDAAYGIAVDGAGNVYVAGGTCSGNFPTTSGALDRDLSGWEDAFVTKLSREGNTLVFSTYLGGSHYDYACGLAVDGAGNVYVTGDAFSVDFPTTPGAFDRDRNGPDQGYDVFISKLSPQGSALVFSTYLGGSYYDNASGIAVDDAGNVYVAGTTWSGDFPTTAGALGRDPIGGYDAFVSKLNADGSRLVFSTYLGGRDDDAAYDIVVDGSGNVYVPGSTDSWDFPTTSGALDRDYNGGYRDAFISKLSPDGSALVFSTYLGGVDRDEASCIAVDDAGNVYVTGRTFSEDFPTTPGALDETRSAYFDAFVCKIGGLSEAPNDAPAISLTAPVGNEAADAFYTIRWEDDDADDDALISLAYDTDTDTANGYTWIVRGLHEDPDGESDTYVWDTSNLPEGGPYYILAVITDGKTRTYDYSQGTVTIRHYPVSLGQLSFAILFVQMPQTDAADMLDVIVHIRNSGTVELKRVKPECYVNGQPVQVKIDAFHDWSPVDGVIDALRPGDNLVRVTRLTGLPPVWEQNKIEVRITAIEGARTDIRKEYTVSAYYMTDEGGRPFDFSRDTYAFRNKKPSMWDVWGAIGYVNSVALTLKALLDRMKGLCLGMSSTAAAYFESASLRPVTQDTHEMDYSNPLVKKNIINYQFWGNIYLHGEEMWEARRVLSTAVSLIKNRRACVVGFQKPKGRHACWAYKAIVDHTANSGTLFLYDPSELDVGATTVWVSLSADTLNYGTYTRALIWHPTPPDPPALSAVLKSAFRNDIHRLYSGLKSMIGYGSPVRMLLTDNLGRRVGFISDSVRVNEIPGAEIEGYALASDDSAFFFIVPRDLEYNVTIWGVGTGAMHAEILKPVSPDSAAWYYYGEVPVTANWRGAISYTSAGNYVLHVDADNDGTVDSTIVPEVRVVTEVSNRGAAGTTRGPVPKNFFLSANYPNPFNESTLIRFGVPRPARVSLTIVDLLGRNIATLLDEVKQPGTYTITWDGKDSRGFPASSGIYLCRLNTAGFACTRKIVKMQ